MKNQQIMNDDIEKLACFVCKKTTTETDKIINNSKVDDIIYEKYGVDLDVFTKIANDLIQLTPLIKTNLSNTLVHAFLDATNTKYSEIIAKVEVNTE